MSETSQRFLVADGILTFPTPHTHTHTHTNTRLAQKQQVNDSSRRLYEQSSTKNVLEATAKRLESYKNSSSLEWIYAYLQVATAENSALEKKVLELEHTVQGLKFKLDHDTYIKEEAKTRARFAKAKPNLTRFLHSRFKHGEEDDHWDAIVAHMKSAGEYHEKLSENILCYELADHSMRDV